MKKNIETKIGRSNLPAATNRYDAVYKTCGFGLVDKLE